MERAYFSRKESEAFNTYTWGLHELLLSQTHVHSQISLISRCVELAGGHSCTLRPLVIFHLA